MGLLSRVTSERTEVVRQEAARTAPVALTRTDASVTAHASASVTAHAVGDDTTPAIIQEQALAVARAEVQSLEAMPAAVAAKAREREAFVRAVWDLWRGGRTERTKAEAVRLVSLRGDLYPILATAGKRGSSALTERNFDSWLTQLGMERGEPNWRNAVALADSYARGNRERAGDPRYWTILEKLVMSPTSPTIQACHRQASREYRRLYPIHAADAIPTIRQVRYWWDNKVGQGLKVLAREGETAHRNLVAPYVIRRYDDLCPNDIWSGDHHQMDLWVKVWDAARECWRAERAWITVWYDVKSRYVVGCRIGAGENPNHIWILEALQAGIIAAGAPPRVLQTDNGKDYLKRGLVTPVIVDGHEHSVAAALGCDVSNAIAYNARSKTVERFFGRGGVAGDFAKWFDSYCGRNTMERPEHTAAYVTAHPERLYSIEQLYRAFGVWLAEDYHQRPTQSRIAERTPPAEVWARRENTGRVISHADLMMATMLPLAGSATGRGRVVGRGYEIHCKHPYFPDPAGSHKYREPRLRDAGGVDWMGRDVLVKVRTDQWAAGCLFVYTPDGAALGVAELPYMPAAWCKTDADHEALGATMRLHRQQIRIDKDAVAELRGGERRLVAAADNAGLMLGEARGERHASPEIAATKPAPKRLEPAAADPETEAALEAWTSTPAEAEAAADDDDEFDPLSMWTGAE